jgi:hypothetical protein
MASIQRKFQDLIYLVSGRQKRGKGRPAAAGGGLIGSQDPILPVGRPGYRNRHLLDLPENVLRPIMMDRSLSLELCEFITWSPEMVTSMTILAQNIFQEETGAIGSWKIRTKNPDGTPMENPPHPNVVAIAENLRTRYNGRVPVLGGERLEEAAWCIVKGDVFMELQIEKEGIGRNDWGISNSIYLPSFSMFINANEQGQIEEYRQQSKIEPLSDDRIWSGYDIAKILHFKHRGGNQRYGVSRAFAQIDNWRKYKSSSQRLEESASTLLGFWLHEAPPEVGTEWRQAYRSEFEALLSESPYVTNVYLPHGADVRRTSSPTPSLTPLLAEHTLNRYGCCLPGVPIYYIPGLGVETGSGSKELSNSPALNYARLIAHTRSILGDQLRQAVALEVVLNYGYQFWLENSDIEFDWPYFEAIVQPGILPNNPIKSDPIETEDKEAEAKEKFVNLNADIAKTVIEEKRNQLPFLG